MTRTNHRSNVLSLDDYHRTRALLVATMLAAGCPADDPGGDGTETATATNDDTGSSSADQSTTGTGSTGIDSTGADSTGEPADALERIYDALGGREALESWSSLELDAAGTRFDTGEALLHDDDPIDQGTFAFRGRFDVEGGRARLAHERASVEPFMSMSSYVETIDGEVGFITGNDNVLGLPERPMASTRIASAMRLQWLLNPHFYLRAVARGQRSARVIGSQELGGIVHDVIEVDDPLVPVELWANTETGLISELHAVEHDFLLGDVPLVVDYAQWEQPDEGGMLFPMDVQLSFDGYVMHDEHRSAVVVDGALEDADFVIPPEPVTMVDPAGAERGALSSQWYQRFYAFGIDLDQTQDFPADPIELAPGIHLIAGGSHHTLAIEQEDGVVLADAPLYEERSTAVRDAVNALHPTKPISHMIVTHFHFDHLGGIRSYISDGVTIVGNAYNESYLESIAQRPHTLVPDELASSGTPLSFEPVVDAFTLPDPDRPIELYWVDNVHSSDMLMVFLPLHDMLFLSDLYSPGFVPIEVVPLPEPALSWATATNDAVQLLGLDVQTLVGAHGGVGPYTDLLTHIGQ